MKNKLALAFVVVAFMAGTGGFMAYKNSGAASVKSKTLKGDAIIKMGTDSYEPQNFTIKKGTTVTFVNEADSLRWPASDLHPSHLIYSEFDPKEPVAKGSSWQFTFNQVGEWGYHDHLAPYITGMITVTE